jgi:hypothetical protein
LSKYQKTLGLLYETITDIDLTTAHTDTLYELPGFFDILAVESLTGAMSIKLNRIGAGSIDLTKHRVIKAPFDRFYYTNTAQPAAKVILQAGGEASFEIQPVITDYVRVTENIQERPITSRRRTGRAFFIDTFEHYTAAVTEKWAQLSGTIALATDYPKCGLNCMKLTTGNVIGNTAEARLILELSPKAGSESNLSFNQPIRQQRRQQ